MWVYLFRPVFAHLTNIAQRQHARKEIVTVWGFRKSLGPSRNSRRAIQNLEQIEGPRLRGTKCGTDGCLLVYS